ncbi:hypothetical protein Nepgr_018290 [Nepenthes gracilis]|uniref:RING-type domain-containing protein n=1 Tax=Nepenthes gracilis TaxID=150966 RepID=A0AAD3ST56_NEPGR|nr:hypothetical protein Nepgr_018290 [Nepenthes gracilis]
MFSPGFSSAVPPVQWRDCWTRLLAPLALWICVSMSLQYGYYGNYRMVLGPSSSRLVKASPLFVKQIEVRDEDKKGALIYGFNDMPELSSEANWTISKYLIVGSYNSQGFSLWLNRGSRIRMRWEAHDSNLNHLQVVIIKGEREFETLSPNAVNSPDRLSSNNLTDGEEAEYVILEDDKYYVNVINRNQRSIIMTVNMNVTSKIYDISKASSMCSTVDNGSCRLNLIFPNTRFAILTTPSNGDLGGWYIDLSFVARVVTYIAILGVVVIIIFLILKFLGACDGDESEAAQPRRQEVVMVPERSGGRESEPLIPEKSTSLTYGTVDDEVDPESGSSSSSDELYDGKICVICYDQPRNCFFVPCGHCATCHGCALRIMEGENKVCPICRRPVHKVKKLITS